MYNSQNIATRIKSAAKSEGKSLGEILTTCGLGKNTVAKINNGTDILTLNFAKIADQLDCSVDYLLGRVDTPNEIHLSTQDMENDEVEHIMTSNRHEALLLIEFRNLNKQGKEYILQTLDLAKVKYKKSISLSDMEDIG